MISSRYGHKKKKNNNDDSNTKIRLPAHDELRLYGTSLVSPCTALAPQVNQVYRHNPAMLSETFTMERCVC